MFRALLMAMVLAFAAHPAMAGFFDAVLCSSEWPDGESKKVEGKADLQAPFSSAFPDEYYLKLKMFNGSKTHRLTKIVISVEMDVGGERSVKKFEKTVAALPQQSFYVPLDLGYSKIKVIDWKVDGVFGCEK